MSSLAKAWNDFVDWSSITQSKAKEINGKLDHLGRLHKSDGKYTEHTGSKVSRPRLNVEDFVAEVQTQAEANENNKQEVTKDE